MLQAKNLMNEFKKRVIGQDHIFDKVCEVIRRGEAGFSPGNEPKGAFLFLGQQKQILSRFSKDLE